MSRKDQDMLDDEREFEAFLSREGELSDLLRALPQVEPSAELDAAVLARAESAMEGAARAAAATDAAATDAAATGAASTGAAAPRAAATGAAAMDVAAVAPALEVNSAGIDPEPEAGALAATLQGSAIGRQAANDAAIHAASLPAKRVWWRSPLPAGLAAGVLAAVIGQQAWQVNQQEPVHPDAYEAPARVPSPAAEPSAVNGPEAAVAAQTSAETDASGSPHARAGGQRPAAPAAPSIMPPVVTTASAPAPTAPVLDQAPMAAAPAAPALAEDLAQPAPPPPPAPEMVVQAAAPAPATGVSVVASSAKPVVQAPAVPQMQRTEPPPRAAAAGTPVGSKTQRVFVTGQRAVEAMPRYKEVADSAVQAGAGLERAVPAAGRGAYLAAPAAPVAVPAPAAAGDVVDSIVAGDVGEFPSSSDSAQLKHKIAKAWLDSIEKLLDANKNEQAWAEWLRFKAAYPNFAVPETVRERVSKAGASAGPSTKSR